jgi:hypothetical protein
VLPSFFLSDILDNFSELVIACQCILYSRLVCCTLDTYLLKSDNYLSHFHCSELADDLRSTPYKVTISKNSSQTQTRRVRKMTKKILINYDLGPGAEDAEDDEGYARRAAT